MASLTQTAYYTRKLIKYGAIGFVILIFYKNFFAFGRDFWRKRHPPAPAAPEAVFGKLPKIEFPQSRFGEQKLAYRLETTSGGTPNLADRAKVYFMPIKKSNLLDLERAKALARDMEFMGEPQKKEGSETIYQWLANDELNTILEMDILNESFTIRKNWQNDPSILMEKALPIKEQAIEEAKNYFNSLELLTTDFEESTATVSLLRLLDQSLVPAISLSEADFVRVDLFRKNLDDLKILPENSKEALVSVLLSGSRTKEKRILEINYIHYPINQTTFSEYPLKTTAQAWEELKTGKAFIANLGPVENEVIIRNISLAYFENGVPQNYLQPIYVFAGDIDFMAYVPAVSWDYLE